MSARNFSASVSISRKVKLQYSAISEGLSGFLLVMVFVFYVILTILYYDFLWCQALTYSFSKKLVLSEAEWTDILKVSSFFRLCKL